MAAEPIGATGALVRPRVSASSPGVSAARMTSSGDGSTVGSPVVGAAVGESEGPDEGASVELVGAFVGDNVVGTFVGT